jgi:hypothetical protein
VTRKTVARLRQSSAKSLSIPAIGWRSFLVIFGLGVAVYWNSFPGTFLFDDFASIQDNASIRSLATSLNTPTTGQSVAGRPIANLSLAIDYAIGQFRPWVYLATNLSIHIVCGMLVLALAGLVSESLRRRHHALLSVRLDGRALTAACVWLVHPLASEPVNYIVARTESLMALSALTTLYASLRAGLDKQTPLRWEALAIVACIIGMGCKESMVVVPLMAILLDRALLFDSFVDAIEHRGRFYVLLASTLVVAVALLTTSPRANSAGFFVNADLDNLWFQYLLNQCRVLTHYAMLLVWPRELVLDYGAIRVLTLRDVLPQLLVIVASVCGTLALWRQSPLRALPIVWALVTLAPTTLVPIVTEVGADRRMYLVSCNRRC